MQLITLIQSKIHADSVLVLQAETTALLDDLARTGEWDIRRYGRNELWFWVKEEPSSGDGLDPHQR